MHAVTAEPIRVSPPEAVVYQGLIKQKRALPGDYRTHRAAVGSHDTKTL